MSQDSKKLPLINRLEIVEGRVESTDSKLDSMFEQVRNTFNTAFETIDAMVGVLKDKDPAFADLLSKKIVENKEAAATAKAEQEKKQIEQLVTSGVIVPTNTIGPKSLIVGRFWKDKAIVHPGRTIVEAERGFTSPEVAEKFMGQQVGFMFELPNGQNFEVLEVYDPAPPAPPKAESPKEEAPLAPEGN